MEKMTLPELREKVDHLADKPTALTDTEADLLVEWVLRECEEVQKKKADKE